MEGNTEAVMKMITHLEISLTTTDKEKKGKELFKLIF